MALSTLPSRTQLQLPMLIAVAAIALMSAFVFLPSVGNIAVSLSTSVRGVQLSIAAYQAAFALTTLAAGAAADRWDRRTLLIGGALLVAFGGIGTALCTSLPQFVGWRMLQAIGASVALVVGRALVVDLYPKDRAVAAIAAMGGAMAIVPMMAPVLGGALDAAVGWRGIFGLMSAYCVAAAGLATWVLQRRPAVPHEASTNPGTDPNTDPSTDPQGSPAGRLLANRRLLGYCLVVATSAFTFHLYAVSAPAFLTVHYGFDALQVGIALALAPLGYFLSAPFVRRRARAGGPPIERILKRACVSQGVIGVVIGTLMLLGVSGWLVIAPVVFLGFTNGWVMPHGFAGAVRAAGNRQGAASGLVAFMQLAATALASLLASAVPAHSAWWVAVGIILAALAGSALVPRGARAPADPG